MDEGYGPTVKVKLPKTNKEAILYESDWKRLKKQGYLDNVKAMTVVNKTFVKTTTPRQLYAYESETAGKEVMLAKVILNAGAEDKVRYRDGNPLNLQRHNLEIVTEKKKRIYQDDKATRSRHRSS